MQVGVVARSEARGLGNQTYEVCRNLDPDRVLLVDPGPDRRFDQHPERYDPWRTTVSRWRAGQLDRPVVARWLRGLDVVYSAETPYDLRLPEWAAEVGCSVVVHANPELLNVHDATAAVTWWSATPWRRDFLPPTTRVVPMPCPTPKVTTDTDGGGVRFLHVAGWPTVKDRNGTDAVVAAAKRMTSGAPVILRGQHRDLAAYRGAAPNLRVEVGTIPNYWDLYRGADVLVMPRRFGGLCLPVLEALAAGLPVVMTDCPPNEVWPGPRVRATSTSTVQTRGGVLPLFDTDPQALAETLDGIATDPETLSKLRREAADWVAANTWDALSGMWRDELERACL
jgi:hypothetical protein